MMNYQLKPITNEDEHRLALERFDTLLDFEEGTPEAYERGVLAILIEKYEDEAVPIPLPSPLDAIKFRLEQGGQTRKVLEPILGGKTRVSEVLSGKRDLTLKMARGLHLQLGIPAESLLGRPERLSDSWSAIEYDKFPVAEMEKNGAFARFGLTHLKDRAEEAIRCLLDFLGGPEAVPQALFRRSSSARLNAKLDPFALKGWCLQVLAEAKALDAPPPDFSKWDATVFRELAKLSGTERGPVEVLERLRVLGVVVVIVPHLNRTYLDGAAFMTTDGRAVIGLTLRYDRLDNFWFALFHELGHLVLHLKSDPGEFFVDDLSLRGNDADSDIEREADRFAEEALLPNFDLAQHTLDTAEELRESAHTYGVSPAVLAGRLQYEMKNYRQFASLVGHGEVSKLFR
jgi:HTH-type transcriptional regulator/antitoxin HigA